VAKVRFIINDWRFGGKINCPALFEEAFINLLFIGFFKKSNYGKIKTHFSCKEK
jgi:hypothetical protein